ncbi:MAG: hypothetical protein WC728_05110 [Elusimicrobiota bacterium]
MERKRPAPHVAPGQILVGVLILLLIMAVMVPFMVLLVQNEAKWTAKQDESTTSFHLAEAGVEKAYRSLTMSTGTWYALIEHGTPITRFGFDYVFNDVPGGAYAVSITSGPEEKQATVISIGSDTHKREIRTLKVIFEQNTMGDIAIQAMEGVQVSGGVDVEWGGVVGQEYIDTGNRTFPQFHSASGLNVDNDPAPPNCDSPNCCQWKAYDPDVPPDPGIDLTFYRTSATHTSGCGGKDMSGDGGVADSCYFDTAQSWSNFTYHGGGTVFIENNLTLKSPGVDVIGTLVVTGNLSTTSGAWGKGSATMKVPRTAWKQYCNNWTHYRGEFDAAAAATFPGINDSYKSDINLTYAPTPNGKFSVQGFLYVGGDFSTSGGGGSSFIYGNMFAQGGVSVAANSGVTVYYNKESAQGIHTTKLVITRKSWQGIVRGWPSGL